MIKRFFSDETGLELSEYAVAAALVAIAVRRRFHAVGSARTLPARSSNSFHPAAQ